jgi:hypothetical protein
LKLSTYKKKRFGGREIRENDGGSELIKIHCKHICKCHNETLLGGEMTQIMYAYVNK